MLLPDNGAFYEETWATQYPVGPSNKWFSNGNTCTRGSERSQEPHTCLYSGCKSVWLYAGSLSMNRAMKLHAGSDSLCWPILNIVYTLTYSIHFPYTLCVITHKCYALKYFPRSQISAEALAVLSLHTAHASYVWCHWAGWTSRCGATGLL